MFITRISTGISNIGRRLLLSAQGNYFEGIALKCGKHKEY
jgi:hypothetical protein